MEVLAVINIGIDPNILDFGSVLLSWHGFFTFVAVALSVFLVHRWGTQEGLIGDSILSVAVWAIIGGIVGARVVHIIDFWGEAYQDDPIQVIYVWRGGIAIYGAIVGGFLGGASYILIRNSRWFLSLWDRYFRFAGEPHRAPLPGVGALADIAAPAVLFSMAVGRIGDIINGEHFASFSNLPWAVVYTHADSAGLGRPASHPAVAYELLFDLALLALIWPLRKRLRPPGMFFAMYGALYSTGRFFLGFLRDECATPARYCNEYFLDLNQAQILALIVILVAVPLMVFKAQFVRSESASQSRRGGGPGSLFNHAIQSWVGRKSSTWRASALGPRHESAVME